MCHFNRILIAVSILMMMAMTACAVNGGPTKTPSAEVGMDCKVQSVSGDVVLTNGCQGWQPLQFGAEGSCMQVMRPEMNGDGSFVLKPSSTCRHFSLQHPKGQWLVIAPDSSSKRDSVCVSKTNEKGDLAYIPCSSL